MVHRENTFLKLSAVEKVGDMFGCHKQQIKIISAIMATKTIRTILFNRLLAGVGTKDVFSTWPSFHL